MTETVQAINLYQDVKTLRGPGLTPLAYEPPLTLPCKFAGMQYSGTQDKEELFFRIGLSNLTDGHPLDDLCSRAFLWALSSKKLTLDLSEVNSIDLSATKRLKSLFERILGSGIELKIVGVSTEFIGALNLPSFNCETLNVEFFPTASTIKKRD